MNTPRVHDVATYWESPPPERSARCIEWVEKIQSRWKPNRRIRGMGYHEAAEWFGVYIWEYLHVIRPLLYGNSP
jgi:hypothetical protein